MSTQFILQASDQVQPTTLVSKCLLVGHACTYVVQEASHVEVSREMCHCRVFVLCYC